MNKYILIPDSFKGNMSSKEICAIMNDAILKRDETALIRSIPVADGGEGSVDCFLSALGGELVLARVSDPYFADMHAAYGLLPDNTAVIEMAACAGLPLVKEQKNPLKTTTFGVGQLMLDAVNHGVKRLIIGLGGSATNDGGCGAACAAGVRFYDASGNSFVPVGGTLKDIARIDTSGLNAAFGDTQITVMCDIDNPMYGENGAAVVFAPQKGADSDMVRLLDGGLKHLSDVLLANTGKDISFTPGAGAAGAMGAGMLAFFNAKLQMGIETLLDTVSFNDILQNADMVFTGEGKIDTQSLRGKVVIGVARRAKRFGVPVTAIVGEIGDGIDEVYNEGVTAIFSINRVPMPLSKALLHSRENLRITMDNIMRLKLS